LTISREPALAEAHAPSTDRLPVAGPPRPNFLYLAHRLPYPPDKGDRIRSFHTLRFLSQRGAIHLACFADEPVAPGVVEALGRYCARVAVIPLGRARWLRAAAALLRGRSVTAGAFDSPTLRATLRDWARQTRFDAALASSSGMAPYLQRPELRGVQALVDLVDVDSQKWLDYAAAGRGPLKNWLYRTEGRRLRVLERRLPTWARAVTLVSQAEADLYREFCAAGSVHAITNGVDLDYFAPQPDGAEPCCAFVGALDYPPNVDAVTWFCREVWPELRLRRPEARLLLIGRRPVPAVTEAAGLPGVDLFADVPDVRPHLARAALAVAPLRIARGVQNKVLEALAMSKAVVASPQALAGLKANPGEHLQTAAAPAEWVAVVDRLLGDAELRRQLGQAGRQYVEQNHRWDVCLQPLAELLGLKP
jgi:sugar transferase (PEP-CTERM/EpsH1 system associated)